MVKLITSAKGNGSQNGKSRQLNFSIDIHAASASRGADVSASTFGEL